jgi:hypothetical protein
MSKVQGGRTLPSCLAEEIPPGRAHVSQQCRLLAGKLPDAQHACVFSGGPVHGVPHGWPQCHSIHPLGGHTDTDLVPQPQPHCWHKWCGAVQAPDAQRLSRKDAPRPQVHQPPFRNQAFFGKCKPALAQLSSMYCTAPFDVHSSVHIGGKTRGNVYYQSQLLFPGARGHTQGLECRKYTSGGHPGSHTPASSAPYLHAHFSVKRITSVQPPPPSVHRSSIWHN